MKVYVAAPWVHKTEAQEAAAELEAAGFEITKKWWEHREVPTYLTDNHENDAELWQQAIEDVLGVFDADVFVLLNLKTSEGKAVETGVAITLHKPIYLIGGRSNLFHYWHTVVRCDNVAAVIQALYGLDTNRSTGASAA